MTFSVLLRDAATGETGAGVASRFLAVGALVLHASAETGAVATQALVNVSFGPNGLRLLGQGLPADDVVARLIDEDELSERRQLAVLDRDGRCAAHTGTGCQQTAYQLVGPGFAALGNVLVGTEVVQAMADAVAAHVPGMPVAPTIVAALQAGDAAGGDRRGRQSAAVLVVRAGGGYGGTTDRVVDLRVDDHVNPVPELRRLLALHTEIFTRPDDADLMPLEGEVRTEVSELLRSVAEEPFDSADDDQLWVALDSWAGRENLEERLIRRMSVDPILVEALRRSANNKVAREDSVTWSSNTSSSRSSR
ncbi:MAG: fimbrial assembly protein FimA [Dactylosporangium sp.]|nr:fimbrial assembly protein FimA [Dactylosporangium sp.]